MEPHNAHLFLNHHIKIFISNECSFMLHANLFIEQQYKYAI